MQPARKVAAMASMALLAALATGSPAHAADPSFASSFEVGDSQPTWSDTVETGADGPRSGGVSGSVSHIGAGPDSSPTAKVGVGFSGLRAFQIAGWHTAAGRGYAYSKIFDVDVRVTANTELSYICSVV